MILHKSQISNEELIPAANLPAVGENLSDVVDPERQINKDENLESAETFGFGYGLGLGYGGWGGGYRGYGGRGYGGKISSLFIVILSIDVIL